MTNDTAPASMKASGGRAAIIRGAPATSRPRPVPAPWSRPWHATFSASRRFALAALVFSALPAAADEINAPRLFGAHEPSYFIAGYNQHTTTARFQFSFKYMLFDEDSVPTRWLPPLSGMHFAYTQTSVWDLSSESKPFRDTSYRPALIWAWNQNPQDDNNPWSTQAGFEHESNGKQIPDSRSINTVYVEPRWRTKIADSGRTLEIGARLFHYLDREENPDIGDYRGHATMMLTIGKADGAQHRLTWRQGRSHERYSLQLDGSYPLRRQYFANTGGYFYTQIFYGHGETLLDYREKQPLQWRLGFAVTR